MSVRFNVRMPKFMRTPIKLGVGAYATYAIYQTLRGHVKSSQMRNETPL